MALKRVPPKASTTANFGRLTLGDQDLRDLHNALDELSDTSFSDRDVLNIRVNTDYEADNIDDVLGFDGPVRSLSMSSVTAQVIVYVTPNGGSVIWNPFGRHAKRTEEVAAKVQYILRQAEEPPEKTSRVALKQGLITMSATSVVGGGAVYISAPWLSNVQSLVLGASISVALIVAISWATVKRQSHVPESVLRSQIARPQPLYRRYMSELMLVFTILPTVVSVAIWKFG